VQFSSLLMKNIVIKMGGEVRTLYSIKNKEINEMHLLFRKFFYPQVCEEILTLGCTTFTIKTCKKTIVKRCKE